MIGGYKIEGICLLTVMMILVCAFAVNGAGKVILRAIKNVIIGALVVLAINWVGKYFGYKMPLNLITVISIGFLGLPGIGMVVLLLHIL